MSDETISRCLRCKKIEYALKRETSIEELKSLFQEEVQKKVINKSYDSIGHLSKSRLGESDSHIDAKQESFLTVKLPPTDCKLYIEEKMDGSNCAVVRKGGEIIAIGRSGYRCSDSNHEQHRRFHAYVEKRKHIFESLLPEEDDRVVGEWLVMAHGTIYPRVTNPYQVFDLFKKGKRLNYQDAHAEFNKHGLESVPLLYEGKQAVSIDAALELASKYSTESEGVVYRLEIFSKNLGKYVPSLIAKVVRMEKEDGKYLKESKPIWMWEDNE